MDTSKKLDARIAHGEAVPFVGVYDVLSATLAARHFEGLFVSGYGFAASHYGLPDIGLIAWPDIVGFVQRIHSVLPHHSLLVDIDDGYGDAEVAGHVVASLADAGAWGVVMEDQRRPRRCGHAAGKLLLPLDEHLEKLTRVLALRRSLFVIARTDASEEDEIVRRAEAFAAAGADAILVDGLRDLGLLPRLRERLGRPLAFNQIAGGKSPALPLSRFHEHGISIGIYSTPCLFTAHRAVDATLARLRATDGLLPVADGVDLAESQRLLSENLEWRHRSPSTTDRGA